MEDLLEGTIALASKKGVEFAEIRYQEAEINTMEILNGKLNSFSTNSYKGIGIRVMIDGSYGFSSINDLSRERIEECLNKAIKLARVKSTKYKLNIERTRAYRDTIIVKARYDPSNLDVEEIVKRFKEIDKIANEVEQRTAIRVFFFICAKENRLYANSDGSLIRHELPRTAIFRFLTVLDPQKGVLQRQLAVGKTKGIEFIEEAQLEMKVQEDVKTLGQILDKGEKLKEPGFYDVLIDGEITGLIAHESCGHPFEADRILGREAAQGGESYIKPEMLKREKIGSDVVTIVDNPLIEESLGFYLYDEEGIPARKKYLIKNGVVEEFLLNREYAARLSLKSNGSARATAYFNEPLIRMSNTYFEPGDYSFEELIEDVKKGVYFKSYMEWNIDDRRWNQKYGGLEVYLVENGEIKGLLRNPVLEITTGQLYKSIDAIGKDMKFDAGTCGKGEPMQGIPVWFGGPTIRARKIWIK